MRGSTLNNSSEEAPQERSRTIFVRSKGLIRAVVLEDMVLRHMQMVISYVTTHEAHFRAVIGDKLKLASDEAIRVGKKKLSKAEKRLDELDRIFMRLYEDRVNGTISDERFASMSRTYEDEQSQLKKEIETLTKEIAQQTQKTDDVERFIAQAHKYVGLEERRPTLCMSW